MQDHSSLLRWIAVPLAVVAAVILLVGTYYVNWVSWTIGLQLRHTGGYTLAQIHAHALYCIQDANGTRCTYWTFSGVYELMTTISVVLVVGAIVVGLGAIRRWLSLLGGLLVVLASGLAIFLALHVGTPQWSTHGFMFFGTAPGKWVCLSGGLIGLGSGALALLSARTPSGASAWVEPSETVVSVS